MCGNHRPPAVSPAGPAAAPAPPAPPASAAPPGPAASNEVVGRVVWKFPIEPDARGNTPIYGEPLALGDAVVLAAMPGVVYAVDQRTGTLRWKVRPSEGSELNGDMVAIGNRLFVTTRKDGDAGESGVFAIDPP